MKTYYRKNLPHIQPVGATFFVTFVLKDSIPKSKLQQIKDEYKDKLQQLQTIKDEHLRNTKIFNLRKRYLVQIDQVLDKIRNGNHFLKRNDIAKIVSEQIHRFDGEFYQLIAYSIMSNHVHLVIDTSIQLSDDNNDDDLKNYTNLDQIMKRIKGASAFYSNKALSRKGAFWETENYDTYIRNEKMLKNVIAYTLNNPVKAGIVTSWKDYKWNYLVDSN